MNQFEKDLSQKQRKDEKEFDEAQARMKSLDTIIEKLYEDNVFGKISDEHFHKMSTGMKPSKKS